MVDNQTLLVKFKKENAALKRQIADVALQAQDKPTKVKLKQLSHYLTAAVALTLANTFYGGPNLALPVGSWMLIGAILAHNNSAGARHVTVKLWDGNVPISAGQALIGIGDNKVIPVFGIVSGGKTWTISAAANGANCLIGVTPLNNNTGCENTGSYLLATRTSENLI